MSRLRLARHVGQAGWRVGYTIAQIGRGMELAGHRLQRAGSRAIDRGDWLAGKVAGETRA